MTRQKSNHESAPEWEPLEEHLKNLDSPELPSSWKKDILNHARRQENSSNPQAKHIQVRNNEEEHWLIVTVEWIQNIFSKLTPVQISMVMIWSFVLIGGKVDHWLNASDESNIPRYFSLSLTESFTAQIKGWELAGLEQEFTAGFEEDSQTPKQKEKPVPGPRSSLKNNNSTSCKVAMGHTCPITLVLYNLSIQDTVETLPTFKYPLQHLSTWRGPGTVTSTFNPIS
ncbi:hypothetical protein OAM01_00295 [bacterium]|nr:hypothetical protein [bacterium]